VSLEGLAEFTARVRAQVAAGVLSRAEAEGELMVYLDRNAPGEAGEKTARRVSQLRRQKREWIKGLEQRLLGSQEALLTRAQEALMVVPDEVWEAAGGALD